ncbi:UDP-4-amino-4,6-dideoxy-N-acetyl-beta-L-altrosamine transaminase [Legionella oakridgensis]|uniref:UDP-4-amino-4, 6-dideoxy-N-acetyl-beta-L-altrosamine transaminase n=1 Tax=Legionella oakridgensis TaxID=29423 RepID=UPI0003DE2FF9|nr:UDP-4-amino-4,6-dideoxy-N-acetyl-beta-L-altrosamine transaminase [Legionella oakridgensis]ETO94520.1 UDP-4-keto-6-deoxy-N-acetylglucosamine 4-aminotransferase [Legionella oakridgensis RV-2-2007]
MDYIPYGRQSISEDDINAVVEVLKSDFLTQGPVVTQFEEGIKNYTGAQYCLAVNSATSALHIACLAMNLGAEDTLWTSPISFVASSNCALYCGARVDFVDIDSKTYNICPNQLEDKLKKTNKPPKIVVPVHLAGTSCDMEALAFLADKYGFYLLEDSSHAIGAEFKGSRAGSCAFSDASVFSFHPVKIITTGEGGAITTNNAELYEKMLMLRSHGITRERRFMHEDHGLWYYEQQALGFNYRITDFQCALGYSQLLRLNSFIEARRALAEKYNNCLKNLPLVIPYQPAYQKSAYHLYIIKVKNRAEVFHYLREQQIGVNVHYIPIHTQPYYQQLGFKKGDFPVAEQYYAEALSLPMYPALQEEEFFHVIHNLEQVLQSQTCEVNA